MQQDVWNYFWPGGRNCSTSSDTRRNMTKFSKECIRFDKTMQAGSMSGLEA